MDILAVSYVKAHVNGSLLQPDAGQNVMNGKLCVTFELNNL